MAAIISCHYSSFLHTTTTTSILINPKQPTIHNKIPFARNASIRGLSPRCSSQVPPPLQLQNTKKDRFFPIKECAISIALAVGLITAVPALSWPNSANASIPALLDLAVLISGPPIKDPGALLRYGLPIDNKAIREVQKPLEDITESLKIAGVKALDSVERNVRQASRVEKQGKSLIISGLAESKKEHGIELLDKLETGMDELLKIVEDRNRDAVVGKQKELLQYVGGIEEDMVDGFPYEVPEEYRSLPLLKGRATVDMKVKVKDNPNLDECVFRIVLDGYNAPVTATFTSLFNRGRTSMDASKSEIIHEVPPWIRVYKDGTIERLAGYEIAAAGLDHQTGVLSKDIIILPETGVSVRLYRPNLIAGGQKLPLVLYFHGGAYLISSISDPAYQNSLNKLVAEAKVILASVDYRRAPENPLPAAFDDSWAALKWAGSHASGGGSEAWVNESVDFFRVFLAGDSAGASIAHHMAVRVGNPDEDIGLKFVGMISINPYFLGEVPIGSEVTDTGRKAMVDNWWRFVCPSDRGNDDPLVNPLADGAPLLKGLACGRVLVIVAEKDILRDRGVQYYEALAKSEWKGKVKLIEIQGEDHVFHIINPNGENATKLIKSLADFIHEK